MTDEKQIAVLRARPERRRLSLSLDHASRRAAPWPSLQLSSITRFTTALAARAALSGRALRQGVDVWNGWRSGNRKEVADLHGTDLRGAKLRGSNLSGANLRGAHLNGATLNEATLSLANLHGADLRGADLRGADLFGADL